MSEVGQSLSNVRAFAKAGPGHRNVWSEAAEANLRQQVVVKDDGSIMRRTPPRIAAAIQKDQAAWNITRIPVPALLIFAHPLIADSLSQAKMDGDSAVEIRNASDEIEDTRRGTAMRKRLASSAGAPCVCLPMPLTGVASSRGIRWDRSDLYLILTKVILRA